MELTDAIRASTAAPAAALGRTDIGRLEIGAIGDASVLELVEGDFEYRDGVAQRPFAGPADLALPVAPTTAPLPTCQVEEIGGNAPLLQSCLPYLLWSA
jgi:cytosine/adenosine deaminase-related metal-dependent hydrolase